MSRVLLSLLILIGFAFGLALWQPAAAQSGSTVYRCPSKAGGVDEFTNMVSAEGAPITIVQAPRPRPAAPVASGAASGVARSGDAKVDPAAQRQRDSDARRILEAELRREEERLAGLKRDFNNGEPERLGSERNYQTYLDRVASMRAGIARSESDVAALKRELAKLPP
jgi:predicted lipid-binding transport protein (Tim44 family)